MASFLFRRSLFFHFKSSNNVKLNDSFNALTEFVRRPILVKNKNISKKRIIIKNKFDPTKSVHFI